MWELASCLARDTKVINDFLGQGFNPFAVTTDAYGERIWLKREIEGAKDALHSELKPDKGTGRGATAKSKRKDSSGLGDSQSG